MKIYTGSGDQGKTSLFSGERLSKANHRIEAYGDVDELNSAIGVLAASIGHEPEDLISQLNQIQSNLFHLSAWLATTSDSPSADLLENFSEDHSKKLEQAMDNMGNNLAPLSGFILPGGTISSAMAHLARTICRRAERHVILCLELENKVFNDDKKNSILIYLNRLSDYLFMLARYLNHLSGIPDQLWKK